MNDKIVAAFRDAVKAQIGDDRNHGWGNEDSLAVIDAVVAADAEVAAEAGGTLEKYTLSDDAQFFVRKVVNPSAFRQVLETEKKPNGETILAKSEKKAIERKAFSIYG